MSVRSHVARTQLLFYGAPPAQPPEYVPQWRHRDHPQPAPAVRRGQSWSPPWPFTEPPPPERPARWQQRIGRPQPVPALRRGQTWSPPWPFVAPPVQPWIPTLVGTRASRRPVAQPRGSRWESPSSAPPPEPSPWTVRDVGTRAAWAAPKPRGIRWDPPWPFTASAAPTFVPPQLGQHRPLSVRPRRGRFFAVPSTPPGMPARFICARHRPPTVRIRAGRFSQFWPEVGSVAPGVWLPGSVVACRRPPLVRSRRGRFFEPAWPFVPPSAAGIPARSTVTETSHTASLTTPVASTVKVRRRSEVTTP